LTGATDGHSVELVDGVYLQSEGNRMTGDPGHDAEVIEKANP